MLIQTVATLSFLPQAMVMFESIRAHHPDFSYSVLVTDIVPAQVQAVKNAFLPNVEVLCCEDLKCEFLEDMRRYYGVLEFNSACKILALHHQLQQHPKCLFLDPDLVILESLSDFLREDNAVVLTPHIVSPEMRQINVQLELNVSGYINGGWVFVTDTPDVRRALDYLIQKIPFMWFVAPEYGMYADQPWLSTLFFFYPHITKINQNPGLNVAYWNFGERTLTHNASGKVVVQCQGKEWPLVFFHFSGFSRPYNGSISRHYNKVLSSEFQKIIENLGRQYSQSIEKHAHQFSHISPTHTFAQGCLKNRLQIAEKIKGVTLVDYALTHCPGRFEKLGRKWDAIFKSNHIR